MKEKGTNNTHYVEIVKSKIEGKLNQELKSFVLPGHIHVQKGDSVTFTALETSAKFIFPNKKLFGTNHEVIETGKSLELIVQPEADSGVYAYAVVTDNNDLASGGSFPRFIVD